MGTFQIFDLEKMDLYFEKRDHFPDIATVLVPINFKKFISFGIPL